MSGKSRILIADDHAIVREGLRALIATEPELELVGEASDGVQAVSKAHALKPDVILLDMTMPRKDGFTLAREIRERDAEVPIIFLTAKTMKEDVVQGFKIGADDYIAKPFNSEELLLRIQAVLKRLHTNADPRDDQREYVIGKYHFNYPLRKSVALIKDRDSGRSKGFAFVEMENQQDMQNAITMFNGKDLQGRDLSVSIARPREERGGGGGGGFGGQRRGGGGGGYNNDRNRNSNRSGGGQKRSW